MMEQRQDLRPHFILSGTARTEQFSSPLSGRKVHPIPELDRPAHGASLLTQVQSLKPVAEAAKQAQQEAGLEDGFGLQIQFRSQPDIELAFESLSRERSGIELLNVRHDEHFTYATVFVPDGKLTVFENLIRDYRGEKKDRTGKPRDNKPLINTIQEIRAAELEALWTDDPNLLPVSEDELIWWEIWLPIRKDRTATIERFRKLADKIGFQLSSGELSFPERTVLLMQGTKGQIKQSVRLINSIAELRRAKETAEFFDSLRPTEQREWVDELLERTQFAPADIDIPYICLLDTGVNRGHPLLSSALAAEDQHSIEPGWGTADEDGHGTQMAGLSLFGDLTGALGSSDFVKLSHRLESVKLLREDSDNNGGKHHGYLTVEAVTRPEVGAPGRNRVFSMAVTAKDSRDRGRPSAWSAAIDKLAADSAGEGLSPRLIVISAGNTDPNAWLEYPDSNRHDSIHDPGQAWNALTVGAYTEKTLITESDAQDYVPIAPMGGLSPFSTTSATWEKHWPLKPDVLLEGGNAAKDSISASWMHSLSLLTVHHALQQRLFTTTNATSAATALCARMAAQLMSAYPDLWPETIRALIVNSAAWTEPMLQMFKTGDSPTGQYRKLIRHCGFGVPDLAQAMWSGSNSLTLMVQESLQPFEKERGKNSATRDMHLHQLPWPLEELQALDKTEVEMRVTLSYFIEPNPAERSMKGPYRYESHGLRFGVKRPTETIDDFRARINRLARHEEERTAPGGSDRDRSWMLGPQLRNRGSLHCDIWQGMAADLAELGILAVYPTLGWWKTRAGLQRYNKRCRYALVVSIRAPKVDVDLYNVVQNGCNPSSAFVTQAA